MTMLGGPLFPSSNNQLWFNKLFRAFLTDNADLASACGCDPGFLGVQSFCKGALTFLSYGSTAGPTSGAIHQREGCSQGKVNSAYILFEPMGDQFIGPIIAGLNMHQHIFAVVPTRFGVRGTIDGVSFCSSCLLFLFMSLTKPPLRFALLPEAVKKLMERLFPISAGTTRAYDWRPSQVSYCVVFAL
jgi:hypothetical protein